MKVMWCWRCQMEVPMLDEEEFAIIGKLYSESMKSVKEFRVRHKLPLSECPTDEHFRPVREAYEQMTGMLESNHNAIMHHRISIYGQSCECCGKPLRTPMATFCPICGLARTSSEQKT